MPSESAVQIVEATDAPTWASAANLFREYSGVLPHGLEYQGFDEELATLPGKYARPDGRILLAMIGGEPVGCVAMRPLAEAPGESGRSCEMKRLYVRAAARGLGAGQLLCEALLAEAKQEGYARIKLDSDVELPAALRLYERLGFARIPAYNDDPMPGTVWMAKSLERG